MCHSVTTIPKIEIRCTWCTTIARNGYVVHSGQHFPYLLNRFEPKSYDTSTLPKWKSGQSSQNEKTLTLSIWEAGQTDIRNDILFKSSFCPFTPVYHFGKWLCKWTTCPFDFLRWRFAPFEFLKSHFATFGFTCFQGCKYSLFPT